MSDTIIVAILGFAGSCIGSLAGIGLIKYRIEQLEKKDRKDNSIVERTIVLDWNQDTTKINLEVYNMATTEKTLWYRIVLMKI